MRLKMQLDASLFMKKKVDTSSFALRNFPKTHFIELKINFKNTHHNWAHNTTCEATKGPRDLTNCNNQAIH